MRRLVPARLGALATAAAAGELYVLSIKLILTDAVEQPDPDRRSERLERWSSAPFARYAQPREDHLLPLMVAAGAGGRDVGRRAFQDTIAGKACSAYRFG